MPQRSMRELGEAQWSEKQSSHQRRTTARKQGGQSTGWDSTVRNSTKAHTHLNRQPSADSGTYIRFFLRDNTQKHKGEPKPRLPRETARSEPAAQAHGCNAHRRIARTQPSTKRRAATTRSRQTKQIANRPEVLLGLFVRLFGRVRLAATERCGVTPNWVSMVGSASERETRAASDAQTATNATARRVGPAAQKWTEPGCRHAENSERVPAMPKRLPATSSVEYDVSFCAASSQTSTTIEFAVERARFTCAMHRKPGSTDAARRTRHDTAVNRYNHGETKVASHSPCRA